jgi:signal transduction histidine kinase/CheY-like chemotaxis protein
MKPGRWVVLWCVCTWVLSWTHAAAAAQRDVRVLVLNSYHPQYAWTEELVRGVRDELGGLMPDEKLHIEYMDARRMVSDEEYLDLLAAVYARKYKHFRPDLIISSDDSALNFLLARRDALFPGIPIVFCGINSLTVQDLDPVPNMTGILEGLDVEGNLQLILRLHPGARRIVLLSDRTPLGEGMQKIAREVIPRFETSSRKIEIWDDFTKEELGERVARLDGDTVLLLLAIHEDRAGHYFSFEEDLPPITRKSPVPMYAMFGMLLGQGVTGGMMNDPYDHGRATARIARRVLAGERADDIPIVPTADYLPRFDYTQLVRFGIDEAKLPPHSFVLNAPVPFYRLHARVVWSALGVMAALIVAVGWLLHLIQRMRRAERQLIESQAELRRSQRLELIGRLAGGIAHDFNNLLVPILTCTDLIEITLGSGLGKARPQLETLRLAGSRASALARQILALSRPMPLVKAPVDVAAAVREIEEMLRRTVSEGASLTVTAPPHPLWVEGDRTAIEQVLVNLVINASDAVTAKPSHTGTIRLSVEGTDAALAQDGDPRVEGPCVRVEVRDDGVGMTPEVIDRIFVPFFSTKRQGRGTGLGLATVQSVVSQHGGAVQVESSVGKGTTMRVLLPRLSDAAAQAASEPSGTRSRALRRQATILVVDDDALVRAVVTEGLKSAGHRVISCEDPTAAPAVVERLSGECDLLISDILMPGMNGDELWDRLHARYPGMRVLFMSGYDAGMLESRGATTGDAPLLRKPFSVKELCARVDEVLATSPGTDAVATAPG